jgi:hypothetical protein
VCGLGFFGVAGGGFTPRSTSREGENHEVSKNFADRPLNSLLKGGFFALYLSLYIIVLVGGYRVI